MSREDAGEPAERMEYASAVYGSMLAASVIVGSTAEGAPPAAGELVVLLICTGVVFWISHAYARVVSAGYPAKRLTWADLRTVARREWPLAQASFPPAVAAAFVSALGGSNVLAAWAALAVAVAGQVAWGVTAAVRVRASRSVVVVSAVANLVLGLALVALKIAISGH